MLILAGIALFITREHEHQEQTRQADVATLIEQAAEQAGLDVALIRAVVQHESSFRPDAVSPLGAKGLMQVMPSTHQEARQRFDIPDGDLFDPAYNLKVGSTYLAYLLDRFKDDLPVALAAYHMGPTRTAKRLRDNPQHRGRAFVQNHAGPATRAYVTKVLDTYETQAHP